jgi:AbrB family looped-hinge helix DNA binding protein
MRTYAKVTSKGQVTVPADVRAALGINTGDVLVLEVKAGYAVLARQESLREVSDRLSAEGPTAGSEFASDDEAVSAWFKERQSEADSVLRIARRGK